MVVRDDAHGHADAELRGVALRQAPLDAKVSRKLDVADRVRDELLVPRDVRRSRTGNITVPQSPQVPATMRALPSTSETGLRSPALVGAVPVRPSFCRMFS